ncbi:MAG: site-2 protease family protein [Myxococcales bacterium]|nr:site-2 protease family protein [Myxococcales bacterium]MBK7192596.1 site-2 protease family protein [Myxococcales bacterium]MBP6846057.1 site-2 protease family protein [Kofleriaceae bacterium]
MNYLGPILALGVLIIVHEAGHFFVARWCGMRVERFSIGFGPAIAKWRSKRGSLFQLAPIPFGGFVEIKGMNIAEDVDPDDKEAYPNKPVWQRILTIFAGPGTNYLAAVLLAFGIYSCAGIPNWAEHYKVAAVDPKAPAHGILQPGDVIVEANGQPLKLRGAGPNDKPLAVITNDAKGAPMKLVVERGGQRIPLEVPTKEVEVKDGAGNVINDADGKPMKVFRMGIALETRGKVGVGTAAVEAVKYPWLQTKQIVGGLYAAIRGKAEVRVTGPVGIFNEFSSAFGSGLIYGLELLMMLNVYLGLFNLLPLPALDGGRLAFLGYELVTRRRANPRVEMTVTMVGVLFLIVLMVFVTFKDIAHL